MSRIFGTHGAWQGQDRLNDVARRAVQRAESLSALSGSGQTGPDALLCALLDDRDGVGVRALAALDVDLLTVRQACESKLKRGGHPVEGRVPLDGAAREVVVLALNEARRHGFEQAGDGHLLLGLLQARAGSGVKTLERQGVTIGRLGALIHELEEASGDSAAVLFAAALTGLLDRLGGASSCSHCGATVHASFHFCYKCGARLGIGPGFTS